MDGSGRIMCPRRVSLVPSRLCVAGSPSDCFVLLSSVYLHGCSTTRDTDERTRTQQERRTDACIEWFFPSCFSARCGRACARRGRVVMTQISRGTEKLDLLKEAPKRKGYGWVCQALQSSTSAGDRCSVNMVDTVLMSVGRPIGWIFTSRDGHVLKKGEGKLNLDTIVKQFAKTSLSYSPNQNPSKLVLVVQEPDSSSNNFVPISQAMEYLRSPSSSAVSVQCFVPPRGGTDSGMFSNYRCEYLLDQYGRHVTRAFRLGVATGFATSNSSGTGGGSGAQTRSMVKSMDSSLNSTLSSHTMNIVRHVEKVKRCKVRKAHCDFVVDATGDVSTIQRRKRQCAL